MRLRVHLFAGLAEAWGSGVLELDVEGTAIDAARLTEAICERHPELAVLVRRSMTAVNHAYASPDTVMTETDEIALIPPVSGG